VLCDAQNSEYDINISAVMHPSFKLCPFSDHSGHLILALED